MADQKKPMIEHINETVGRLMDQISKLEEEMTGRRRRIDHQQKVLIEIVDTATNMNLRENPTILASMQGYTAVLAAEVAQLNAVTVMMSGRITSLEGIRQTMMEPVAVLTQEDFEARFEEIKKRATDLLRERSQKQQNESQSDAHEDGSETVTYTVGWDTSLNAIGTPYKEGVEQANHAEFMWDRRRGSFSVRADRGQVLISRGKDAGVIKASGQDWTNFYEDDMIVFGPNWDNHRAHNGGLYMNLIGLKYAGTKADKPEVDG